MPFLNLFLGSLYNYQIRSNQALEMTEDDFTLSINTIGICRRERNWPFMIGQRPTCLIGPKTKPPKAQESVALCTTSMIAPAITSL